ncbi:MAG: hypothetical protein ABJE95_08675 [Byssovorax sp.]
MASPRWPAVVSLVTLAAAAFSACSSATTPTSGTASGTASSSAASGSGGAGGEAATTATGAGGATEDAGPLSCAVHSYTTIKTGPCDLLAQNCPEGKTCKELQHADGSWGTQCVTANGLKAEGETCTVDEECRARLTCAAGRCAPVCCAATNAPCLGGICNLSIQLDNAGKVTKQVCLYSETCDLLTENACPSNFLCQVRDPKQGLATCIQPSGFAPDLGPCHFLNECATMEHCLGGSPVLPGKCHFYCYRDQANPASPPAGLGGCPAGQTCQASPVDSTGFDFSLPNVGLCAPGP